MELRHDNAIIFSDTWLCVYADREAMADPTFALFLLDCLMSPPIKRNKQWIPCRMTEPLGIGQRHDMTIYRTINWSDKITRTS